MRWKGRHFSLESNTVTIKAGERTANVRIRGIYDNIEVTDSLGMVLQLVSKEESRVGTLWNRNEGDFGESMSV